MLWDSKSSREKRKELAASAGSCAACAGFKWHQGSGAGSIGLEDEQSPTLTADYHNPAVLHIAGVDENLSYTGCLTNPVVCMTDTQANTSYGGEVCGTLTSHAMKDAPVLACGDGRQNGWAVRRLTPRECERLQGFPDDWTLIPWKGRPAEECPDGPRYKAIGNSMAVPVMRWIFERMDACAGVWQRSGSCYGRGGMGDDD